MRNKSIHNNKKNEIYQGHDIKHRTADNRQQTQNIEHTTPYGCMLVYCADE